MMTIASNVLRQEQGQQSATDSRQLEDRNFSSVQKACMILQKKSHHNIINFAITLW